MDNGNENLMSNVPREQRYAALKEVCTKTTFEKVRRHYNDDEKNQIREHVANESIANMERKDEFAVVRKEFNEACKAVETELRKNLTDLKRGYSENEEDVFCVADQDGGVMRMYDRDGVFLYSRRLFPEERQTLVIDLHQKAS